MDETGVITPTYFSLYAINFDSKSFFWKKKNVSKNGQNFTNKANSGKIRSSLPHFKENVEKLFFMKDFFPSFF